MLQAHLTGLFFGALSIIIHYETVSFLLTSAMIRNIKGRRKLLVSVFVIFLAHGLEIWMFALAIFLATNPLELGTLTGNFDASVRDFSYFATVAYTSLGFGDIVPTGNLRILVGYTTLTGLLMMAWTAAFSIHVMQNVFKIEER